MARYKKTYDPKSRVLYVEVDRTQPGTAGGNCSDEDWDRIFSTKDGKKTTRYAHREIFDRDIFEQTLQCRDTDAVHGEARTIERFETQWIAYVLTADRGRVALPATVVAHDCPEYGSRFVTEDGTCPDCGYIAYGQTSVAADDVPEDDTKKSEPTCDPTRNPRQEQS